MTDLTKVLDALEAAEKAAMAEPWRVKENADFIAITRNALPALIAVARAAKKLRDVHAAGFGRYNLPRPVAAYRGMDDLDTALVKLGEVDL